MQFANRQEENKKKDPQIEEIKEKDQESKMEEPLTSNEVSK